MSIQISKHQSFPGPKDLLKTYYLCGRKTTFKLNKKFVPLGPFAQNRLFDRNDSWLREEISPLVQDKMMDMLNFLSKDKYHPLLHNKVFSSLIDASSKETFKTTLLRAKDFFRATFLKYGWESIISASLQFENKDEAVLLLCASVYRYKLKDRQMGRAFYLYVELYALKEDLKILDRDNLDKIQKEFELYLKTDR